MSFQEIMLYCQQNTYISYILMGIVSAVYILIGVLVIVFSRKKGYNVCLLGAIPVVQLFVPFGCWVKGKRKVKKQKKAKSKEDTKDSDINLDEGFDIE